jgi:hypothetical protein
MNELRDGLRSLWETVFAWLPKMLGALVVLIVAFIISKVVSKLLERALHAAQLDNLVHNGRGGQMIARVMPSPSHFLGRLAFWVMFLFGISVSVSVLGIPALDNIVHGVYNYLPNVIAAILIFLVAGAIAAAVDSLILRVLGDTPTGKIAASAAPIVIMGIAVFMVLDQLKIAPTIITITYAALMGSLFLGLALAFGLGGREVAARMLEGAYATGKEKRAQFKQDMAVGRARATDFASQVTEDDRRTRRGDVPRSARRPRTSGV